MPVELDRGSLKLRGAPLWLDARRKSTTSFVSHAHSDHIARHEHVIATPQTLRLMEHRLGALPSVQAVPYRQAVSWNGWTLELFPAGHVLGAAQLRATRADGHRVVYTGDFSSGESLTAEAPEVVRCDTLVMECTFGHPRFRFPPRGEVYDQVADWARRQLARGVRPILYAYALGKSQESIKQLTARGLRVCAHPTIHDMSQVYTQLGMPIEARRFEGEFEPDEVGVFPPFGRSHGVKKLEGKVTAVLTGWALEPWAASRYGADVAFPVSDHADFPALLEYAKASGAREVIAWHGLADDFAAELRKQGLFARAATKSLQMELPGLGPT